MEQAWRLIPPDAAKPLVSALKKGDYLRAERMAVELVRKHPFDAQGWVYLGESLLHLGYGEAASQVFERAWLLDPQAAWTDKISRLLRGLPKGEKRADIDELLRVPEVSVAAGILARDEERAIARCLDSLQDAVDQIVLIDTGSTDRTLEIASRYEKVQIVHFDWCDDFSAARNEGLNHMDADWVLWVDADEYLEPKDKDHVRLAAGLFHALSPPVVFHVGQLNHKGARIDPNYDQARMFPLRRGLTYKGRVHEQVVAEDEDGGQVKSIRKAVRIRLHHDGYSPEVIREKDKLNRNLRLLEKMVREEPDNPGWWFFYGRESWANGEREPAVERFKKAAELAESRGGFSRILDVHMWLTRIYGSQNRMEEAEYWCRKALQEEPNYPDALYELARMEMKKAVSSFQEAEKHLTECKRQAVKYRGTVSADPHLLTWKADLALADLSRLVGKLAQAQHRYQALTARYPHLEGVRKNLDFIDEQRRMLNRLHHQDKKES